MVGLTLRRINSKKRDDKIDRLEGRHIIMRLAAARDADGGVVHCLAGRGRAENLKRGRGPNIVARKGRVRRRVAIGRVGVRGNLVGVESHGFDPADAADDIRRPGSGGALVNRHSAEQVGQVEGGRSIAAVGRPDQIIERFVLRDRNRRPVAKRPTHGRKIEADHSDFSNVWL